MALTLDFNAVEAASNKEIWIYDTTGLYHSVNNPNGWGGINPSVVNVAVATVTVTMPDAVTLQPSTDATQIFVIDVYPTLPNTNGTPFIITVTDLGLLSTDILIDGEYVFEYTVSGTLSGDPFTYTTKFGYVFFNRLKCCADSALADTDLDDCGCAPCRDKILNTLLIQLGVQGVIANNNCGKPNKALEILKTATGLCNGDECAGCN